MNSKLILHSTTQQILDEFILAPSHALLILGPRGIGKRFLAEHMLAKMIDTPVDKVAMHPFIKIIEKEKSSISIDTIRELQHFLSLKTTGKQVLRRAVIIEDADAMTIEAQNALLKLLEEPPQDTIMILTTGNRLGLLPTIQSRVQTIAVHTPAEAALKKHFSSLGKSDADIGRAYLLSNGLPGLMTALINETDHPLQAGVHTAKQILQAPLLQRLILADQLSKQKEHATHVLQALQYISQTGLAAASGQTDLNKIRQWHNVLKVSHNALRSLENNANAKLVLTNLMLHLS